MSRDQETFEIIIKELFFFHEQFFFLHYQPIIDYLNMTFKIIIINLTIFSYFTNYEL